MIIYTPEFSGLEAFTVRHSSSPQPSTVKTTCVVSDNYSYPDRPRTVKVGLSSDFDVAAEVVLSRSGDIVKMAQGVTFESGIEDIAKTARQFAYREMALKIGKMSPDAWSEYMFGHIKLWTPAGLVPLTTYIIDLNDRLGVPREEIAQRIERLMGPAMPKIPLNPLSWILEDRPVSQGVLTEVLHRVGPIKLDGIGSESLTLDKINTGKISGSSLKFHKVEKPAQSPDDGKEWMEVGYVLPDGIDIAEPMGLSIDTPPGDVVG